MGNLETPEKLRALQKKLYVKAKREPQARFYLLYDKVYREDILHHAYWLAKSNGGAAGVDGETFFQIEAKGREEWLAGLGRELREKSYRPQPVRRVELPKPGGGLRPLGIPTIRDRVVQTAAKLLVEPIFEADFSDEAYGYRPGKSAQDAVKKVHEHVCAGYTEVVDADITSYFDTIPHQELMQSVARRISDKHMLSLIKSWLKVPVEVSGDQGKPRMSGGKKSKRGVPQGGVISPLLANIYLRRLLCAFEKYAEYLGAKIVAYADDFVILSRHMGAKCKQWAESTLGKIGLTLNEEKTKVKDATVETFDFLGYRLGPEYFRKDGHTYQAAQPSTTSIARLKGKIGKILSPQEKAPLPDVRRRVNRLLDGWSNYFSYGTRTMAYRAVDNYVLSRVQQFLRKRHKCHTRGTSRFTDTVIYEELGFRRLRDVQLGRRSRVSLT